LAPPPLDEEEDEMTPLDEEEDEMTTRHYSLFKTTMMTQKF
jgi:hypothetical protein